ncbi:MAG: hypothetical protein JW727_05620 [Candidatus Aenigmarchaeota archaeon]|nr:hypothetical protein [Candidatus Aenigmarchaeota archaeon]
MRESAFWRGIIAILLVLIIPSAAFALEISQPRNLGMLEFSTSYSAPVTIKSQETSPQEIELKVTPRSEYLKGYMGTDPIKFTLQPNETKTVNVTINVPIEGTLSPGSHTLTIVAESTPKGSGVQMVSSPVIEVSFSLRGEVMESVALRDLVVNVGSENVVFTLYCENTGNVRAGIFPTVDISKYYGSSTQLRETVRGKTQYLLEPGGQKAVTLSYPVSKLEGATYKASAKLEYSGKTSSAVSKNFVIGSSSSSTGESKPSGKPGSGGATSGTAGTISIGGTGTTQSGSESADLAKNVHPLLNNSGEVRITNLYSKITEDRRLIVYVGIENLNGTSGEFRLWLNLFSGNGTKIDALQRSGNIEPFGSQVLDLDWVPSSGGNIKIEAVLESAGENQTKILWTSLDAVSNSADFLTGEGTLEALTGRFTGIVTGFVEGRKPLILLVLAALLVVIYLRESKKDPRKQVWKRKI